jgi:hypothetical protein
VPERLRFEQLKKSLQQAQQELSNREKEWQSKQAQASKAEHDLRQAQQTVSAKAELLATQLRIFQQLGLPPKERAFQQFLSDAKRLFKNKGILPPTCFISYAWEDDSTPTGKAANEQMQQWLGRLTRDLRMLGMNVFFDLDNIHGSLRAAMRYNIAQSDYFILIGTPRLRQRIEDGLTPTLKDCIENNCVTDLQIGLQKLKDNALDKAAYDPKNNVTFEFIHIWIKVQANPNALIPLHYSGSFAEAIPLAVRGDLARDAKGVHENDEKHYGLLVDLSAPLGIISAVYQLRSKERQTCLEEYQEPLLEGFKAKLERIKLELERAKQQAKLSVAPSTALNLGKSEKISATLDCNNNNTTTGGYVESVPQSCSKE